MRPCSETVFVDQPVERPHIRRLSGVATPLRPSANTPFQTDKLVERGYDADHLCKTIEKTGAAVVIPPRRNRKAGRPCERHLYTERNQIERFFNKLKQFRRVATRYDKLLSNLMGFVKLFAIAIWIK